MEVESELEPVIDNAPSPAPIGPPAINADILGAAATTRSTSRTSPQIASAASSPATSTRSLKRSAEMMEEDDNNDTNYSTNENDTEDRQGTKRKRLSTDKQDEDDQPSTSDSAAKNKDRENPVASTSKAAVSQEVVGDGTNAAKLVEEIGVELTCGCCTGICYNPVIVLPCQHYYCGR
jgi:E3 ubiquitin-protein ligase CHFR